MSDDPRFDPRFDPAFQPGYEGPLTSTRLARGSAAPAALPTVGSPVGATAAGVTAPPTADPEPTAFDEDEPEPAPRRLNPFIIALLAAAVALVGGGAYLVSRLRDLYAENQLASSLDYVTLQVLAYAAPLLMVLGLATGVGVLFLLAARRERRAGAARGPKS